MSRCSYVSHPTVRAGSPGLTLLELVVVLGILAVLSSMAVRSLQPLADQARYEATVRLLSDLRLAIAGSSPHRSSNGPAHVYGYVADTGQLPADTGDLLSKPTGLIARTLQNFDSDRDSITDVSLTSGWQGPYLNLTVGQNTIQDGWARPVTLTASSGGLELISLGSDGDSLPSEEGYRADIIATVLASDFTGEVICRLFEIDSLSGLRIDPALTGGQKLGVLFYGVNAAGGTSGAIEEQLLAVPASGSFEVRRADTPHGTVALRAILWDDLDNDGILDAGESIIKKSYVHYLQVNSSMDNRVEMDLR